MPDALQSRCPIHSGCLMQRLIDRAECCQVNDGAEPGILPDTRPDQGCCQLGRGCPCCDRCGRRAAGARRRVTWCRARSWPRCTGSSWGAPAVAFDGGWICVCNGHNAKGLPVARVSQRGWCRSRRPKGEDIRLTITRVCTGVEGNQQIGPGDTYVSSNMRRTRPKSIFSILV